MAGVGGRPQTNIPPNVPTKTSPHPPPLPLTFLRIPRGLGRRYEVSLLELYLPESCEFIHRRT